MTYPLTAWRLALALPFVYAYAAIIWLIFIGLPFVGALFILAWIYVPDGWKWIRKKSVR